MANITSNFKQVNESEVFLNPITEENKTSLLNKLSLCGLTDMSTNLTEDTYTNNSQSITQDLVLTENELGALLNAIMFDNTIYLGELNISNSEKLNLELKLKVDTYTILQTSLFKNFYLYCNINFDLDLIEGKFTPTSLNSYIYGYEDEFNEVISPNEQSEDLMAIFNGNDEIKSMAEILGASSIEFSDGNFIAKYSSQS